MAIFTKFNNVVIRDFSSPTNLLCIASFRMSPKPILYSYWRSSCSWRVRIALNMKGIDYEYRTVNLLSQESLNAADFVAASPNKKVPAFGDDGHWFNESLAIIEYIDEKYPNGPSILPKCPVKKAQTRALALQIVAGIQPIQNLRLIKYLNAEEAGKGVKWAAHWLNDGLKDLEAMIVNTAGKYSVGDDVTIADLCIPSIIYNAKRFNVDVSQFPTVMRINEELGQLETFKNAEPESQPDASLNA